MGFTKQTLATVISLALLTACGGGSKDLTGGSSSSTTTTTTTSPSGSTSTTTSPSSSTPTQTVAYTISMRIQECANIQDVSTCQDKNSNISTSKPNRIVAIVTDSKGAPVGDAIVAASTTVGSTTAQQLTNAQGEAFFNLSATSDSSNKAGTVTVTSTVKGVAISTSQNFQFGAGTVTEVVGYKLNMSLKSCTDIKNNLNSCTETNNLPVNSNTTSLVEAEFLDINNQPVKDALVTAQTTKGVIKPGADKLTGADGKVSYFLAPDAASLSQAGTVTLTAKTSVNNTDYSASNKKNFQFGETELALTLTSSVSASTELAVGSVAELTAKVVDGSGKPFIDPVVINFSSSCVDLLKAILDKSVTTFNGEAKAIYRGTGPAEAVGAGVCGMEDTIQASIGGSSSTSAIDSIKIKNSKTKATQILATAPNPLVIYPTGSNGSNQTQVTFTVVDEQGYPMPMVDLKFALHKTLSGLDKLFSSYSVTPSSGTTDQAGKITVTAIAGAVPIPFTVYASQSSDPSHNTNSAAITVGSGYAETGHISLAHEKQSINGWTTDGVEDKLTVRLNDHTGATVPDNTPVTFVTEGAGILGTDGIATNSCRTKGGYCEVKLVSQEPRPRDGRITILAYTLANESYEDSPLNGYFDKDQLVGVEDAQQASDPATPTAWTTFFNDAAEPFLDKNFDHQFTVVDIDPKESALGKNLDKTDTIVVDLDGDGQFSSGNNKYNGMNCSDDVVSRGFCERKMVYASDSTEIILSGMIGSAPPTPTIGATGWEPNILLEDCTADWKTCKPATDIDLTGGKDAYIRFTPQFTIYEYIAKQDNDPSAAQPTYSPEKVTIKDNPMPTGSTITVVADGIKADSGGGTSYESPYPNTSDPIQYQVVLSSDGTPGTGKFSVKVESDGQIVNSKTLKVTD